MRVFVTGATGFIGAHLCRSLVERGHEVVALARDPKKAAAELPAQGLELLRGDLSLFEQSDVVIPPCDVVVHLAGVVAAPTLAGYERVNFTSVKHLVSALARQSFRPRRFLFASSLAAAGPSPSRTPMTEQDTPAPVEPYGISKLKAEQYLASEAPFPVTSFRPSLVFGARDTASLAFYKMAKRGFGMRVRGAPQDLSFIDIDDAVAGIVAMMDDESDQHRTYFLASHEQMDTEVMWQAMSEAMGRKVRVVRVPRSVVCTAMLASTAAARVFGFTNQLDRKQYDQMVAPAFLCSSEALTRAHGWRAQVSLTESFRKAYQAYVRDGWL